MRTLAVLVVVVVVIVLLTYFKKSSYTPYIHLYLISLPKDVERRINFEKFYTGSYEHVEAVNAEEEKDSDTFKNWGCLPDDSKYGTKALQMSNVKVFRNAIKNNYEWIVILEDDAEPPPDFREKLYKTIEKYPDSKVVYLDGRNPRGEGVIPGSQTSAIMYHNSVFELLAKELNPETGEYRKDYNNKSKNIVDFDDCVFDFFLANLLSQLNIKTSSEPIVASGRFDSTIEGT
jgi:hypothetical protein